MYKKTSELQNSKRKHNQKYLGYEEIPGYVCMKEPFPQVLMTEILMLDVCSTSHPCYLMFSPAPLQSLLALSWQVQSLSQQVVNMQLLLL